MIGFLSTPPCLTVQPRPGAGRSCSTCPSGAVSLHIKTPLSTASEYREYRPAVQPSRAAQIRAGGSRSSGGTQSKKPLLERLLQQRKWGIAFLKCNTSHQVREWNVPNKAAPTFFSTKSSTYLLQHKEQHL